MFNTCSAFRCLVVEFDCQHLSFPLLSIQAYDAEVPAEKNFSPSMIGNPGDNSDAYEAYIREEAKKFNESSELVPVSIKPPEGPKKDARSSAIIPEANLQQRISAAVEDILSRPVPKRAERITLLSEHIASDLRMEVEAIRKQILKGVTARVR